MTHWQKHMAQRSFYKNSFSVPSLDCLRGRGTKQMLQAGAWPAQAWAKETCVGHRPLNSILSRGRVYVMFYYSFSVVVL